MFYFLVFFGRCLRNEIGAQKQISLTFATCHVTLQGEENKLWRGLALPTDFKRQAHKSSGRFRTTNDPRGQVDAAPVDGHRSSLGRGSGVNTRLRVGGRRVTGCRPHSNGGLSRGRVTGLSWPKGAKSQSVGDARTPLSISLLAVILVSTRLSSPASCPFSVALFILSVLSLFSVPLALSPLRDSCGPCALFYLSAPWSSQGVGLSKFLVFEEGLSCFILSGSLSQDWAQIIDSALFSGRPERPEYNQTDHKGNQRWVTENVGNLFGKEIRRSR